MCNISFIFPNLFTLQAGFLSQTFNFFFYRDLIGSKRDERLLHKDIAFLQLAFIRLALKEGGKKVLVDEIDAL